MYFFGCGIINRIVAITAEAKTYFAMLFHGMAILTDLCTIVYRTKNIANRAAMFIAVT